MANMTEFKKRRTAKEEQGSLVEPKTKIERTESPVASPMLGQKSKASGGVKRTERMSLVLPVTGSEIELTAMEVEPSSCVIHPRNQRFQSLLRLENPKVSSLKEAIKREKQREPVISRWIEVDGRRALEVLDGSRRRYVCNLLHQENPSVLLKSWVGKIPDVDAEHFAKFGNDDREDVSAWEKAMSLKLIEKDNPDWSHEVIAVGEKLSRQSVTNLLQVAEIPLEFIELLESPDLLKVNSGLRLVKLIRNTDISKCIKVLRQEAPFKKLNELVNRLDQLLKPKTKINSPSANRKVEIKKGNSVRAAIGVNRKKPGQYKIDLFELTEDEYQNLVDALEKILN